MEPRYCEACDLPFTPAPRTAGRQRFCSPACRYRFRDLRWRMYDEPAGPPAPFVYVRPAGPPEPKLCETCGASMSGNRRSPKCRRCTAYTSVKGQPYVATCDTCGTPFVTVRTQGRYRCRPCRTRTSIEAKRQAKRRRRGRKRSAHAEPYVDREIYERDGFRCQLCGGRLSNRSVPHPQAATIDHIVPLARGGDDTPANVQAAHFLCNSRKGDRAANDQLRLI